MDLKQVIDYLSGGGLVAILTHGMGGVPNARAWLRRDLGGRVTHTFKETEGGIGGNNIPFFTLQHGKIAASRRSVVVAYLQSFGLNPDQADLVIRAIGIEGPLSSPPAPPSAPHAPDDRAHNTH